MKKVSLVCALSLFVAVQLAVLCRIKACTAVSFGSKGERMALAKSYDWDLGHGMAIVNKRDMEKRAAVNPDGQTPARWRSRFGSITFTQFGREFPLGGLNEMGLVAEIFWLNESRFSEPGHGRPVLNELQWIQYQLDLAQNVDEAIALAQEVHVLPMYGLVHYMICDQQGECATFEYLQGELVIHSGAQMVANVLTNNTYAESIRELRLYEGFGGSKPIPHGAEKSDSISRFVRGAWWETKFVGRGSNSMLNYGRSILESVRNVGLTQWQLLYLRDPSRIYFSTTQVGEVRSLDPSLFDYSCKTPMKVLDLNWSGASDAQGDFVEYSDEFNQRIIAQNTYLPQELLSLLGAYPAWGTYCDEP